MPAGWYPAPVTPNPYAPPGQPPRPPVPTTRYDHVWATARKRGALLIGCGSACGGVNVLAIRYMHSFYAMLVVMAPGATFLGVALMIIGNRKPSKAGAVAMLAAGALGALIGVAVVFWLRGMR